MCFRCYITESPHTSIFLLLTWRRSSVGNICESFGTVNNYVSFFSLIHAPVRRRAAYRRQHSVSSVIFFFFYLVWWHLTLITPKHPDIVPIIPFPRHSCQVRASLSRSTRLIEWASKCLSLFCRDAFITLARTVRRRNRTVPLLSRQATNAVTWDERSERKGKKKGQ